MKKIILIGILALMSFSISAQTTLEEAVNFSVKDTEGNTIELFDILDEGKIAVIDFYRTDCGYCNIYAPNFQEAFEAFGCNTSNVFFYTIDQGHTNAEVIAFESQHGLEMQCASGLECNGDEAFELYNILSTPTMIVIKPDREISTQYMWPPETDTIINHVEAAGGIQAPCATSNDNGLEDIKPTVYPNPATSFFSIDGVGAYGTVRVYDHTGRVVLETQKTQNIALSSLQSGIYFVTFSSDEMTRKKTRLIIK
jgi:peroxiredoxin